MKLTITKELKRKLRKMSSVVQRSAPLPQIEYLLFKKNQIIGTDLQVWYKINVDANFPNGGFLFHFRRFKKMVDLINVGGEMEIFLSKEGGITIKVDSGSFKCHPGFSSDSFPKEKYEGEFNDKVTKGNVYGQMKTALKFIGSDELRPVMAGILFDGNDIVSTDAHRLYFDKTEMEFNSPMVMPGKVARLIDNEIYSVKATLDKSAYRYFNDSEEIVFTPIDGKFPQWKAVIPNDGYFLNIDRSPLLKSVNFCEIAASANVTRQVRLEIKSSKMSIVADSENLMDSAGNIFFNSELDCSSEKDITIGFNARFLLDVLNCCKSEKLQIKYTHANRAIVLNDNFLVMPVLIN